MNAVKTNNLNATSARKNFLTNSNWNRIWDSFTNKFFPNRFDQCWPYESWYEFSYINQWTKLAMFQITNEGRRRFYCPNDCGRSYLKKFTLTRHLKFECGKTKQFKCSFCFKYFSHKSDLKTHTIVVHKVIDWIWVPSIFFMFFIFFLVTKFEDWKFIYVIWKSRCIFFLI